MISWWWVMIVGALAYVWGRRVERRDASTLPSPGDETVRSVAACLEDPSEEWIVEQCDPTPQWPCVHTRVSHISKPLVLIEDVQGEVQLKVPRCFLNARQQRRMARSIGVAKTFIVQRTTGELPDVSDLQRERLD